VVQSVVPLVQPVVNSVAPAIQAPLAAAQLATATVAGASSAPAGTHADGGAGVVSAPRTAALVPTPSASGSNASTTSVPQPSGTVTPQTAAIPSARTTRRHMGRAGATSACPTAPMNQGAHLLTAMERNAAAAAKFGGELRSGAPARHGREGMPRATQRAQYGPAAPLPSGLGFGNGGDGATGAGAGSSSGAAETYSRTVVHPQGVTVPLRVFAWSHAPEPFLLLLERPG